MQQQKTFKTVWYVFSDILASAAVWIIVTHKRKLLLQQPPLTFSGLFSSYNYFYESLLLILVFWIILFAIAGVYNIPLYKKSRLKELTASCIQCLIGSVAIMFIIFFNDNDQNYLYLYSVFFLLLSLQILFIVSGRLLLITIALNSIKKMPHLFNTIIIGSNAKATNIYNEIKRNNRAGAYNFLGFIAEDTFPKNSVSKNLPCLGSINDIEKIIQQKNNSGNVFASKIKRKKFRF